MVTSSIRNLGRHLARELVQIALNSVNADKIKIASMLNHNSFSMYWKKTKILRKKRPQSIHDNFRELFLYKFRLQELKQMGFD